MQLLQIAEQKGKIESMSQELKHRRDLDMKLASAGESPQTISE